MPFISFRQPRSQSSAYWMTLEKNLKMKIQKPLKSKIKNLNMEESIFVLPHA